MKVIRKGREYKYDYVLLHLRSDIRDKLKNEAKKENLAMGQMILKMLNDREA
jgi:hypothetical protein